MADPPSDLLDVIHARMAKVWPERPEDALEAMGLIGRIRRLNTLFEIAFSEVYGPLDMQEGEYDIIAALMRAGSPYSLSPTELKKELTIPAATVTKRLYSLERKGLISRERRDEDRRSLLVRLSPTGLKRVHMVYPLLSDKSAKVLENIERDLPRINKTLRALLLAVEESIDSSR